MTVAEVTTKPFQSEWCDAKGLQPLSKDRMLHGVECRWNIEKNQWVNTSRRTSAVTLPWSISRKIISVKPTKTVSTLWLLRYADWWLSSNLLSSRWLVSWEKVTRSKTLERKGRFDMGLKFWWELRSEPGFLSTGCTLAIFKDAGTTPHLKLALMIEVMPGTMVGRHFFKRSVGMGSRLHVFVGDLAKMDLTSSTVTGRRWSRVDESDGNGDKGTPLVADISPSQIAETLSW